MRWRLGLLEHDEGDSPEWLTGSLWWDGDDGIAIGRDAETVPLPGEHICSMLLLVGTTPFKLPKLPVSTAPSFKDVLKSKKKIFEYNSYFLEGIKNNTIVKMDENG